jgi:putative alpha-1,2-mannosidase
MGFYSFSPGNTTYSIGRPIFDEVEINLQAGKKFIIKANNNSSTNKYIQTAKLNGKEITTPFFTHKDLISGGSLEFQMNNVPK